MRPALTAAAVGVCALVPLVVSSAADASRMDGASGYASYDHTAKTVTINGSMLDRHESDDGDGESHLRFPDIYRVDRTTGLMTQIQRCTGQRTDSDNAEHDGDHDGEHEENRDRFVVDVSCAQFSTSYDYLFVQTRFSRDAGVKNTLNQTMEVETRVRVDGTNDRSAPVFSTSTNRNVPYDPAATWSLSMGALAQGLGSVTYTVITDQASAPQAYGSSRIPCSDFNPSTGLLRIGGSLCTGSETYAAAFGGGSDDHPVRYQFKVRASDGNGGYSTNDITLKFGSASSTNHRPTLSTAQGENVTVTPGTPKTITFTGSDVDSGQIVNFSASHLPSWATLTTTPGNPGSASLVLSAPVGTNDGGEITVTAYDNGTFRQSSSKEFHIQVGSAVLPPGEPSITSVTSGNGQLAVAFTAPTKGGTPTSYTLTSKPDAGATVTTSCGASAGTCTATGLTNGMRYEETVAAVNSAGAEHSDEKSGTPQGAPKLSVASSAIALGKSVAYGSDRLNLINSGAAPWASGHVSPTPYTISPAAPAGMTFNVNTGTLTGTPTTAQAATLYTITAANAVGSSSVIVSIEVTAKSQTIQFTQPWGMQVPSSGTTVQNLVATSVDTDTGAATGNTVSFSTSSSGCSIVSSTQLSVGTSTSSGTCTVTATQAGGNGYAAATSVQKSVGFGKTYTDTADATQPSSMGPGCPNAGSTDYRYRIAPIINIVNPTRTLTLGVAATSYGVINSGGVGATFTGSGVGTQCAINYDQTAFPGFGYTVSPALPAGLSLDRTTGLISGTPTAVQASKTYTLTLKVRNRSTSTYYWTATGTFTIAVGAQAQTVSWGSPPAGQNIAVGAFSVSGGATASSGLAVSYSSTTPSVCSVSGTTVTLLGRGTCTLSASQAGDGTTWAAASPVTTSFRVSAPPAIRLSTSSGAYTVRQAVPSAYTVTNTGDAADSFAISPTPPPGMAFDTTTGALFGTPTSGQSATTYSITATNGAGTSAPVTFSITITKAAQVITFDTPRALAVTGDPTQVLTATSDSALPVSLAITAGNGSVCSLAGTTLTALAAGTCTVQATQAGDRAYAAATPVSKSVTVTSGLQPPVIAVDTPVATMISGLPAAPPYLVINSGGPPVTYALTRITPKVSSSSGVMAASLGGVAVGEASLAANTAGLPTGLGFDTSTGLISSGTPTGTQTGVQYSLTATNSAGTSAPAYFTLNVTNVAQTITFAPLQNMIVGDPDQAAQATSSSGLAVTLTATTGAGTVCSVANGAVHAIGAGTCTITATQPGDSVFDPATPVSQTFTVAASLTAPSTSLSNASVTLTATDPVTNPYTISNTGGAATTYSISPALPTGLVFDATTGLISGKPVAAQAATSYSIRGANTAGLGNAMTLSLTIVTKAQTVTLAQPDAMTVGDPDQTLSATATSGQSITYASTTPTKCTVSGNLVTAVAAGTCTVTATQTDGVAYTTASDSKNFTVYATLPAPAISISPATVTLTYGQDAGTPYAIVNSGGAVYPAGNTPRAYSISPALPAGLTFDADTGQVSGAPTATSAATTYTVTAKNATGQNSTTVSLAVQKATASVNLDGLAAVYDGTAKSASATTTPLGLTVNLTYDGSGTAPTAVGSYIVVGTVSDTNYQGTATGTLVIAPAPTATFTGGPTGVIGATSGVFTFTGAGGGGGGVAAFQCRMDGAGSWAPCATGDQFTGFTEGAHYLDVRPVDGVGTIGASVRRSWTVDLTGPVTTISSGPTGTVAATSATLSFTASDALSSVASYQCRIDSAAAGDWVACTSPKTYTGLADGNHAVDIRAIDSLGNLGAVQTQSWTINSLAVGASIDTGPASPTNATTATFTVSSNTPGATFECQFDGGAWGACSSASGHSLTGLGAGVHTLQVRATAGGQTSSPQSWTWRVSLAGPGSGDLQVNGGQALANTAHPGIVVTDFTPATGTSITSQSLTRAAATLNNGTCGTYGSATAVTIGGDGRDAATLTDHCYRYVLAATDDAGNTSTVTRDLKVDLTAPTGGTTTANGGTGTWTNDALPTLTAAAFADTQSGLDGATLTLTRTSASFNGSGDCAGVAYGSGSAVTITGGRDAGPGPLAAGCYRYENAQSDLAGNGASHAATVGIDRTNPTGGGITVNGGTGTVTPDTHPAVATTAFTDANAGIATEVLTRAHATWNGASCGSYTGADAVTLSSGNDTATLADGCYRYDWTGTDRAGNAATVSATVRVDSTALGVSITSSPPAITNATTATFAFASSPAGASFECSLDGGTWGPCPAPPTFTGLPSGSHTLLVRANDGVTTSVAHSYTWVIVTTPPAGGGVVVNGGTPLATSPHPTVTITDYVPAAGATIASQTLVRVPSAFTAGTCGAFTATPVAVTLSGGRDAAALEDGCYEYRLRAVDTAGNDSTTTAEVHVDHTAPAEGGITANGGGSWTQDANPLLTVAAFTDPASGLDNGTLTLVRGQAAFSPGGGCAGASYAGWTAVTITAGRDDVAGGLAEGCYRYQHAQADLAGNQASITTAIGVDRTPPTGGTVVVNDGQPTTQNAHPSVATTAFGDSGAGILGASLKRAAGTFDGTQCGGYGSGTDVVLSGGADAANLAPGCYRYDLTATDLAGNAATASGEVQVLAGPAAAPAPDLRLQIQVPSEPVRKNIPFPARAIIANVGDAAAEDVTITTTAPEGVEVVSAQFVQERGASQMEMRQHQVSGCTIAGRVVTCRVARIDPTREHVIEMVMVARAEGIQIAMTGNANAANATRPVSAGDVVNSTYDTCTIGSQASDICMSVQSLRAKVSASLTARRRTVASGQQIPVVVHVANASGVTGPVQVSIPFGLNMSGGALTALAAGQGQVRVRGNDLFVVTPSLGAGQSVDIKVFIKVVTPVTVTKRILGVVSPPGGTSFRVRTQAVTITGRAARTRVTG